MFTVNNNTKLIIFLYTFLLAVTIPGVFLARDYVEETIDKSIVELRISQLEFEVKDLYRNRDILQSTRNYYIRIFQAGLYQDYIYKNQKIEEEIQKITDRITKINKILKSIRDSQVSYQQKVEYLKTEIESL